MSPSAYILVHQTLGGRLRAGALFWPVRTMERQCVHRNVGNTSHIHMIQITESQIKIRRITLIAKYELGIIWKFHFLGYNSL
jgi:hypothetical protein